MTTETATFVATTKEQEDTERNGIGSRIRQLRQMSSLSLNELARAADISPGTLSQIERDRASPSMRTLTKIRQALGVGIAAFFGEEEVQIPRDPSFLRRLENRTAKNLGPRRMIKELITPAAGTNLSIFELQIPPGGGTGEETYCYPGEKAGLVLSGTVVLEVAGESGTLRSGDAFCFDANAGHRLYNQSNDLARVIWVTAPRALHDSI